MNRKNSVKKRRARLVRNLCSLILCMTMLFTQALPVSFAYDETSGGTADSVVSGDSTGSPDNAAADSAVADTSGASGASASADTSVTDGTADTSGAADTAAGTTDTSDTTSAGGSDDPSSAGADQTPADSGTEQAEPDGTADTQTAESAETTGAGSISETLDAPQEVIDVLETAAALLDAETANVNDTSWYTGDASSYTLTTANELRGLAKLVNKGNTFEGITIKLGSDITITGDWTPIGTYVYNSASKTPFSGEFDGCGYTITLGESENAPLEFEFTQAGSKGLFAYVKNGVIHDLNMAGNANVSIMYI